MSNSRTALPRLSLAPLLALSISLGGCNAAFLGNLFVLGVSVAIFFGTLSLGRSAVDSRSAEGSRSAGTLRPPSA